MEMSSRLFEIKTISFGTPEEEVFTFNVEYIIYYY
jgi:hypothetical protein